MFFEVHCSLIKQGPEDKGLGDYMARKEEVIQGRPGVNYHDLGISYSQISLLLMHRSCSDLKHLMMH